MTTTKIVAPFRKVAVQATPAVFACHREIKKKIKWCTKPAGATTPGLFLGACSSKYRSLARPPSPPSAHSHTLAASVAPQRATHRLSPLPSSSSSRSSSQNRLLPLGCVRKSLVVPRSVGVELKLLIHLCIGAAAPCPPPCTVRAPGLDFATTLVQRLPNSRGPARSSALPPSTLFSIPLLQHFSGPLQPETLLIGLLQTIESFLV